MRRVQIPETSLEVSAPCYGLASFGTSVRGQDAQRLYQGYRDAGGNSFDTAHCHGFWGEGSPGAGERALGLLLRQDRDRRQVVIATKGGHPDAGIGYLRPERYLAPEVITADITESLERLAVEYIDLYYLHRDDPRVPVGEIMDLLNAEIADGHLAISGPATGPSARQPARRVPQTAGRSR